MILIIGIPIITILLTIITIGFFIYRNYKKYKYEQFKIRYLKQKKYLEYQENIANNNDIKCQNKCKIKEEFNYNKYYKPKRYVITLNELKFYTVLMEIAKELDLIVFSQVSLSRIIETKRNLNNSDYTKYFNKIKAKSIDFILVDKLSCKIKLCIELDDSTHNRQDRIERDKFINQLFKNLEINLLRYPVYNVYYKETLKAKIIKNMKEHYYKT